MASLVYHSGALGDFITALPAISRWREMHAGEEHVLLGRPVHGALASPPFDETWDAQAREFSGLFSGSGRIDFACAPKLAAVSSALLFAGADSPLREALRGREVKEIVRQDPFPSAVTHVVDYHLSLFAGTFSPEDGIPRISIGAVRTEQRVSVAVHPGSGSPKKNWPLARFADVAGRLTARGQVVAWITGPAESGWRLPREGAAWPDLPLSELAGLLSRCRLFLGNDSGVAHLAAATGCPTVALFGESDPRVWAPRGARVRVISSRASGMKGISVTEVLRACEDFLDED